MTVSRGPILQDPFPFLFRKEESTEKCTIICAVISLRINRMACGIRSPPERILRSLWRGVNETCVRNYRAAVCQKLKEPLIIQNLTADKELKSGHV